MIARNWGRWILEEPREDIFTLSVQQLLPLPESIPSFLLQITLLHVLGQVAWWVVN